MRIAHLIFLLALALMPATLVDAGKTAGDGFVPMFNGKDLTGWVNVNCAPETFFVKDDMVITTGKPTGFLSTSRHYENFSVASRFVYAETRRDLMRIYAYCRTTDDLGDESPGGSALPRLERWRDEVQALFNGVPPVHPVLVALQPTVERRTIPPQPFLDLIAANVQDQHVARYRNWDELIGYCRLSAAPVGRMVLVVLALWLICAWLYRQRIFVRI